MNGPIQRKSMDDNGLPPRAEIKRIRAPLTDDQVENLLAGDELLVSGVIYTARDAAHRRMINNISDQVPLPFALEGQIIYYVGPCPAPPGRVTGSAGPTTSSRMDVYTPALLERGLKAMIGKGPRGKAVIDAMIKHKAVYLAAVGGAGAYLARRIIKSELVAYSELGPEAVYRYEVEDFPCTVAIDCRGRSLYVR